MSDEVDDFLAHYGVLGMKWGKHKARTPSKGSVIRADRKAAKGELKDRSKELTSARKELRTTKKAKGDVNSAQKKLKDADKAWVDTYLRTKQKTPVEKAIQTADMVTSLAFIAGSQWAIRNPDKVRTIMQRSANAINKTKAIDVGYKVVSMTFKNGVWS